MPYYRSFFVALSILSAVGAAPKAAADGPLDAKLLDAAAFAQWVDGKETPVSAEQAKDGPAAVVLTDGNHPKSLYGIRFGLGRAAGPRHLRIGFTKSIPIGSVLVCGGGRLSVLKPEASYPGDRADDSQWIPAERIVAGEPGRPGVGEPSPPGVSGAGRQAVGEGGYASWLVPAGTSTRALRLSDLPP